MELSLSEEQQLIDTTLQRLFDEHAGPARSRELSGHLDRDLLGRLSRDGFLDIATASGPLDATLLIERSAEAVACAPLMARVLVAPLLGLNDLPDAIGLVASPRSLVRFAGECDAYLFLDGDDATFSLADDVDVEIVPSRSIYPLGRVQPRNTTSLGSGSGSKLRRLWQAGLGIEIGSLGLPAVAFAAEHVTNRVQFDRPIGSFQAVQNRLSRSHSMSMATRWLSRRAAWNHDDEFLTASAATFGCLTAREVYDNTHQVTGGIGITTEYGLVEWTIRLLTLHGELGGGPAHSAAVARARSERILS